MKTPMQKMIDYLCSIGEYEIVDKANELLKEESERDTKALNKCDFEHHNHQVINIGKCNRCESEELQNIEPCFYKADLQHVYENVDTNFQSFEDWYEEYILPI